MKLLDKYNRISLITTVLVIIITGFIYYFTISLILTKEIDEDLASEENEIFDHVKLNNALPQIFESEYLKVRFDLTGNNAVRRRFTNIQYWDSERKNRVSGRELITSLQVKGKIYRVSIIQSKVETEGLIRVIFFITLGIIFILILILFIINRLVIGSLWKPFYQMLRQIKLFNLTDNNTITVLDTAIDEFNDMNQEVTAMSLRVNNDYRELKNFVDNASHELMTPLAVINSKLDTLVQSGGLTDRQGTLIGEVYAMVSKMRKLNRSMLLISKIENGLIHKKEQLDLKQKTIDLENYFQELLAAKNLQLTTRLQDVSIMMNKELLDILLNNLLGNAIRHNIPAGEIEITLNDQAFTLSNTGQPNALEPELIFQRFYKSADSDGTGLGLTLSREICESSGYMLTYTFNGGRHIFTVRLH
ncbi:hypothetical protein GCM10027049_01610 [Mucilaginibacter puniceus]